MSVVKSRPALRWLVPAAAAVLVIGGGAAAGTVIASADPALPERSAAQLLVDVQNAKVDGLSGTIVENADLGLGPLANVLKSSGKPDLTTLIAGSNTARVWYAGEEKMRVALLGEAGETDFIRNGTDVWLWNSAEKTANHMKLAPGATEKSPESLGGALPKTPQEAADAALAAIDPTTNVSTTGAAKVAGRDAYELVLSPKDTASLIGQVRLAIDAEHHIPLRVDVYAKNATSPAVRVAFQQISFDVPDAEQFAFNAPPGTKVTENGTVGAPKANVAEEKAKAAKELEKSGGPTVVGEGWTSIVKVDMGKPSAEDAQQLSAVDQLLPEVSGAWGKGRLFSGTLFSVLVIDDGRVFAGAVAPEKLYEAAAK